MRIFVSYTIRDSYLDRGRLSDIDEVVQQFGAVFVDALHNDSDDRQARVEAELTGASIVLFVRTSGFVHSQWVNWERRKAAEDGKKCIEVALDEAQAWVTNLSRIELALREGMVNETLQPTAYRRR